MNLTMTRAEQTACAEPGIALRRPHDNPATQQERGRHADDRRGHRLENADAHRDRSPEPTISEQLGMVLLGIDFETTIA